MPIKGLSERRRLPRLGKIHLGVKVEGQRGEYPKAVDHFVLPDGPLGAEIAKHYGPEPKVLDIAFPTENREDLFPQYYKCYRSGIGLYCKGDGESAQRVMEGGGLEEVDCPCDELDAGRCKQMANLRFLIPAVSLAGVFQLDTSSYNSIVNVNSGMDAIQSVAGRLAMVPATLEVVPIEVSPGGKRQTRWVLSLQLATPERFKALSERMQQLRADLAGCAPALPPPELDKYEEGHLIPASIQTETTEPAGAVPAGRSQAANENEAPPRSAAATRPTETAAGSTTTGQLPTTPAAAPSDLPPVDPDDDFSVRIGEAGAKRLAAKINAFCKAHKGYNVLDMLNNIKDTYSVKTGAELTAAQAEAAEKWLVEEAKRAL